MVVFSFVFQLIAMLTRDRFMVKRGQIYGYLRFYQGTDLWSTRDRFSVDNFFIHRLWITFFRFNSDSLWILYESELD
ncbi:hypothetical protein HMPREF9534_03023 [Escherichia coli MS 69-1]|nr:hypothetical protein HMPREF9534_03023 [Escherichia coli MS 69-1]